MNRQFCEIDAGRRACCFNLRPSNYIVFHINWAKHRAQAAARQPITFFPSRPSVLAPLCFRLPRASVCHTFCFVNCLPCPLSAYGPPTTSAGPSTHDSLTSLMLVRQVLFVILSIPASLRLYSFLLLHQAARTILKCAFELTRLERDMYLLSSYV